MASDLPKLIGLCGVARAGKDTVADALTGAGHWRTGFADKLKADVAAFTMEHYGLDPFREADKVRLRELLVFHGATKREQQPDHWLCEARKKWRVLLRAGKAAVVPDCRYVNELQAIVADGGQWVLVNRPGYGPANDEEARSFGEIGAVMASGRLQEPLCSVINDAESAEAFGAAALAQMREAWQARQGQKRRLE